MLTVIKINEGAGFILVDHDSKTIEKITLKNKDTMETIFPGISSDYNYLKLFNTLKYYMDLEESGKTFEEITDSIKEKGFFFPLLPSLRMTVETIERKDI